MFQRLSRATIALAIAASLSAGPLARPASASTGSTYTMIESALALIGGIILYNNYEHKRQAANTVVGYTRNGGTVYGDGRVVMPNGATVYPNSRGQYPWGQMAYYQPGATGYAYDYDRTGEYDRTRRHSYYAKRYARQRADYDDDSRRRYDEKRYFAPRERDREWDGDRGRHGDEHSHHGGRSDHD